MAKRIRKRPLSEIRRNRPEMAPARTAGRARKPIFIPGLTALEGHTLMATLVVGGPGFFATIQGAVDAAAGSDTIQINSGTYTEQVTIGRA
jgi:pectin methylesterase-like acyl-CoA thioesterase